MVSNHYTMCTPVRTLTLFVLRVRKLELSPDHLVDDAYVALDYLHYLGAYILIHIVRHRDAVLTVLAKFYGCINCL